MDWRTLRDDQHLTGEKGGNLGPSRIQDLNDIGPCLTDQIEAAKAQVDQSVLDIPWLLLGPHEHALDLGVVDRRIVGAGLHGHVIARLGEEVDRSLLQVAVRNSKPEAGCAQSLIQSMTSDYESSSILDQPIWPNKRVTPETRVRSYY